jgi:hypothetical protein
VLPPPDENTRYRVETAEDQMDDDLEPPFIIAV